MDIRLKDGNFMLILLGNGNDKSSAQNRQNKIIIVYLIFSIPTVQPDPVYVLISKFHNSCEDCASPDTLGPHHLTSSEKYMLSEESRHT